MATEDLSSYGGFQETLNTSSVQSVLSSFGNFFCCCKSSRFLPGLLLAPAFRAEAKAMSEFTPLHCFAAFCLCLFSASVGVFLLLLNDLQTTNERIPNPTKP